MSHFHGRILVLLHSRTRTPMDFLPIHTIFFLVCWSLGLVPFCASDSRLLPNKPLSPGNTLISDDGTFALGFFSPSNSTTKHYYVGIWYNNILPRTVVWVANRGIPIMDTTTAKLTLTSDSDLVLSNTDGHVLWTTNTSGNSLPTTGATAILDNTGNFILRSSIDDTVLWQSFDYPTDTFLPGMDFRISHETHALQHLTPWKDPQDPSPGNFSFGADPNSFFQRFVWNGSRPYWRSPLWPSYMDVGNYREILNSTLYMSVHRRDDEIYVSFGMSSGSMTVLLKVDYSGLFKLLTWDSNMSKWIALLTVPARPCNTYGYCGPSGYCDNTEPIPTCKCLNGFEPNSKDEWTSGKFSQGCIRKEPISCGHRDGFLTLTGMKLPDRFFYVRDRSFDECVAECSSNCSCVAYAYANMGTKAINGDDTRCLIWMGELIDTEKLTDQQGQEAQDLYVRLNGLSGSKRKSNVLKIALLVPASLLTLVCICFVWIRTCRGKRRIKKFWERRMQGDLSVSDELGDGKLEFPFLRFREIAVATNNFADSNMLGRGGFGNVYKGMLEGGTEIAVKRLSKSSGQGIVEFRNEVILIAKLQHRSLVKLLGFCIHGDEKLLIYEFLPNKSLDAFLFNDARKSVLDWPTRFKIIGGVARGLLYLHQDSRLKIIHRDLKASNILLDADMSPKISDFGMARIFGSGQQHANTNRVVGTYGYMSPEYALEGAFSVKSDVYSFGVLLLEIVSGIKISSTHQLFTDCPNLRAHAWSIWNEGNPEHLVDSVILESCSLDEVVRCIHVGLLCVQDDPNDRPLMSSVVSILENGATALPAPKQPMYYAPRNHDTEKVGENIEHTVNDMSLTPPEGR